MNQDYDRETLAAIEAELTSLVVYFSNPLTANYRALHVVKHRRDQIAEQLQVEQRRADEWVEKQMNKFDSLVDEFRP